MLVPPTKVIAPRFLPTQYPICLSILSWLCLDRLGDPFVLSVIVYFLLVLLWVYTLVSSSRETYLRPDGRPLSDGEQQ